MNSPCNPHSFNAPAATDTAPAAACPPRSAAAFAALRLTRVELAMVMDAAVLTKTTMLDRMNQVAAIYRSAGCTTSAGAIETLVDMLGDFDAADCVRPRL